MVHEIMNNKKHLISNIYEKLKKTEEYFYNLYII